MLNTLDFAVVAIYLVILVGLGFFISFRRKHSEDYFLAGRKLKWYTIGLSIFGTNVSPMMLISSAGVAYAYGMVANNFEWLAWIFLLLYASVFLPFYMKSGIVTLPQFIRLRYDERTRDLLSWIIVLQITIGVGSVLFAGSLLLSQILGWPLLVSILFMAAISASFTITGGLEAVVITDSFQSIFMIVACAVLVWIGLDALGGWQTLRDSTPDDHWKLFRASNDPVYPWHAIILGYPVMATWFWCTNQTIVQRSLAANDLNHARLGIVFTSYLKLLIPVIFFLPGLICRGLYPDLDNPDEAFMTMVTGYLPHGMIGLIVAVLVAALISTINSMLNSGSTIFTLDIWQQFTNKRLEPNQAATLGKWSTFAITLLGIIIAYGLSNVEGMQLFDLINSIFSFLSPSLVVIFLFGAFFSWASPRAAYYTLLIGNIPSIAIGVMYLAKWPSTFTWPHFLLITFYLFVGLSVFMAIFSWLFPRPQESSLSMPSFKEGYENQSKYILILWLVLAVIMAAIYAYFI